jgi:hypothetical protein
MVMRHQSETHVEVACDVPGCAAADREPLPDLSREWFAHDRGVVAYQAGQRATNEIRRRGWHFCEPWEGAIRGARDLCPVHHPHRGDR